MPQFDFSAQACSDLAEQERILKRETHGWFMELAPIRARTLARRSVPWLFRSANGALAGGYLVHGRAGRGLQVVVVDGFDAPPQFWQGMRGFAREHRVSLLAVYGFGDTGLSIPSFPEQVEREKTTTFMIDLAGYAMPAALSKGHRWCLGKARKAGLARVEQPLAAAARDHARLCGESFDRRRARGEDIETDIDAAKLHALVETGHAALMQAGLEGRVLSSHLVASVEGTGYYLSSGTSAEGMEKGASHFLMCEAVRELQAAGCHSFNLGFSAKEGLVRFKTGFGARAVQVEYAEFDLSSRGLRLLRRLRQAIRR